jgi:endonuclease/exonuclease/phosphatase family metal-dependent hydrolase
MTAPKTITIATWNCAGALRRKLALVDSLGADIIAIQECEDPARSRDAAYRAWAGGAYVWAGQLPAKGLGLFARASWAQRAFAPLDWATQAQYFLSARIAKAPVCAIWAHRGLGARPYIGQIHLALQSPPEWLEDPHCVLLGDFNSNLIWDKPNSALGHAKTMARLVDRGFSSAYHSHFDAPQGREPHPSFYLHRAPEKPYHIDFAYFGRGWRITDCKVGAPADWLAHSDHMPLSAVLTRQDRPALP